MLLLSCKDPRKKWAILLVSVALGALLLVPAALSAPLRFSAVHTLIRAARLTPVHLPKHRRQPEAKVRPYVTISLYERTVNPAVLRKQGCNAAQRGAGGILILDFGRPGWNGHTYGTMLFSGRFAGNPAITQALKAFARGYAYCRSRHSHAHITIARGTSNYHPHVRSAYRAGQKWAHETLRLSRWLKANGLSKHIDSAAADDVEPAWDRGFHKTRDFYRGFRDAHTGHLLYNYGSLDGGVGSIWNARQAFYVAGGMRFARAIPEIYNRAMAHEWAKLARIAHDRFRRKLQFAGVLTQHQLGCACGYLPDQAHKELVRALAIHVGDDAPAVPATLTNIRAAG
jgi:hypothetical protein